jgi:[calcium/calmodulin-dependent protein kinase] kinase
MAIMKKLDHPNVLRLFEIIDNPQESKIYLITEFVKNGSLANRLKSKPKLSEEQMRKIFRQLITAVEYCHYVPNIIHRDIKPDNILIDEEENIKLGDFGVSLLIPEDGSELVTSNAGSDKFFSPEACMSKTYRGRVTDLWACGVTLYVMATGTYPFKGTHQQLYTEI